jgi:glutathione synthase/RimK-type ligase-like ATP-grasp enzyme
MATAIELFESGNLPCVDAYILEPSDRVVLQLRLKDSTVRFVSGSDVGLNTSSSASLASNKRYVRHFLSAAGLSVPRGQGVILRDGKIHKDIASLLASTIGLGNDNEAFPLCIKSASGRNGTDVFRCDDWSEAVEALTILQRRGHRSAIIEEWISLREYRIVVFESRVAMAYERVRLVLTGDGERTTREILDSTIDELTTSGRLLDSSSILAGFSKALRRAGMQQHTILAPGQLLAASDVANAAQGASLQDVSKGIDKHWSDVCVRAARSLGLRFAGVDLACVDLMEPEGAYSIFEVNASPGLHHFASLGEQQKQSVRLLYREALRTATACAIQD